MRLYEFQAKELFCQAGLLPAGYRFGVISSPGSWRGPVRRAGRGPWVVKAQVLAGGRGKAGGIRRVRSLREFPALLKDLLGSSLVNAQTGPSGEKVGRVLVEMARAIRRELYLGIVQDRRLGRPVVLASSAGGMDIEEVARTDPDRVVRRPIDPVSGLRDFEIRQVAYALDLGPLLPSFCRILRKLGEFAFHYDCTLIEINPLAEVEGSNELLALDAKVVVDDNSLFRHPELAKLRDAQPMSPAERQAVKSGISYVRLSGRVGCLVNGAGLAMATMDLIKLQGGEPANFLDVGGGANVEQVTRAFRILLSDRNVRAVLVNIFGGIMKCDIIATALVEAVKKVGLKVPLVVRLEGTHAREGKEILQGSGLPITPSEDLSEAARIAVEAARA